MSRKFITTCCVGMGYDSGRANMDAQITSINFVGAMSILANRRARQLFLGNLSRPLRSAPIHPGVMSLCKRPRGIQNPVAGDRQSFPVERMDAC